MLFRIALFHRTNINITHNTYSDTIHNAEIVRIIYKYKIFTHIQVEESVLPNKFARRQLHLYEIQIVCQNAH